MPPKVHWGMGDWLSLISVRCGAGSCQKGQIDRTGAGSSVRGNRCTDGTPVEGSVDSFEDSAPGPSPHALPYPCRPIVHTDRFHRTVLFLAMKHLYYSLALLPSRRACIVFHFHGFYFFEHQNQFRSLRFVHTGIATSDYTAADL